MANESDLQSYLERNIPMAAAMGARVEHVSEREVRLWAPLLINSNHKGTVFGGSLSNLLILSAWGWLWSRLANAGLAAEIVIQDAHTEFLIPVAGDFEARAEAPEATAWATFEKTLRGRGRARLTLGAQVVQAGDTCVRFQGRFVALLTSTYPRTRV